MKHLVVNDKGEEIWVDQAPIWRINPVTGKEIGIGYLPDGSRVTKPKPKTRRPYKKRKK